MAREEDIDDLVVHGHLALDGDAHPVLEQGGELLDPAGFGSAHENRPMLGLRTGLNLEYLLTSKLHTKF